MSNQERINVQLRNGNALKILAFIVCIIFFIFLVLTRFSIFYKPSILTLFVIAIPILVIYLGSQIFIADLTLDFSLSEPRLIFNGAGVNGVLTWPFEYRKSSERWPDMEYSYNDIDFFIFSDEKEIFKVTTKMVTGKVGIESSTHVSGPGIFEPLYVTGENIYKLNELYTIIETYEQNNVSKGKKLQDSHRSENPFVGEE